MVSLLFEKKVGKNLKNYLEDPANFMKKLSEPEK
jgi:hypothetical protein